MARRKKQATKAPEAENTSIFEHFGYDNDGKPASATSKEPEGPSVTELLERIKGLETKNEEYQRNLTALMTAPAVEPTPPKAPNMPQISMEGMPDPIDQPKEYAAELNKRIAASVTAYTRDLSDYEDSKPDYKKQAADLWDKFKTTYEDYADDQEKVEFAAGKAAQLAKAKGLDLNKYMFGPGQSEYLKDVKDQYVKVFGEPDDGEEEGEAEKPAADDTSRSTSVFSGFDGMGKPSKKPSPAEVGDMLKDIEDIQRKTGFY